MEQVPGTRDPGTCSGGCVAGCRRQLVAWRSLGRPSNVIRSVIRILHTSDWHLGHALHDLPRDYEHGQFLAWLLDALVAHAVDALLITGDVFDAANPPARASAQWFEFLAAARRRCPALDVVVIAGNHDSAARLDAPSPCCARTTCAWWARCRASPTTRGSWPPSACWCRCATARRAVAAVVAAVPFLRPADLPAPQQLAEDPLIDGVRAVYAEAPGRGARRRQPGQALLATGHCFMVGTEVSRLSERRILGGHQHALPVSLSSRRCRPTSHSATCTSRKRSVARGCATPGRRSRWRSTRRAIATRSR